MTVEVLPVLSWLDYSIKVKVFICKRKEINFKPVTKILDALAERGKTEN
jgi:hypothetical protein